MVFLTLFFLMTFHYFRWINPHGRSRTEWPSFFLFLWLLTMAILRVIPLISPNHKYQIFTLFLACWIAYTMSFQDMYNTFYYNFIFSLWRKKNRGHFAVFAWKIKFLLLTNFEKKSKFAVGQIWANNFDFFLSSTFQCIEPWWNFSDSWRFPKYRSRFVISKVKSYT